MSIPSAVEASGAKLSGWFEADIDLSHMPLFNRTEGHAASNSCVAIGTVPRVARTPRHVEGALRHARVQVLRRRYIPLLNLIC